MPAAPAPPAVRPAAAPARRAPPPRSDAAAGPTAEPCAWRRADGSFIRGPRGTPPPAVTDAAGLPPQGARMTRAEYLARRFEYRAEWVDGRLDYLPMPRSLHAALCSRIYDLLYEHLRGRRPKPALRGATVYIRCPRQFREPDAALLLDPSDPRIGAESWDGADLVVEVVSPDDPDRDYAAKREDYAAAGVREYWIVDARDRTPDDDRGRSVTVLTLDGEDYRETVFREGGTAAGSLLPGFAPAVTACLTP